MGSYLIPLASLYAFKSASYFFLSASSAKGSSVQGYYNAKTHEIQFIVNYNMMNVRSECFKQTIDKSRLATFDAEPSVSVPHTEPSRSEERR